MLSPPNGEQMSDSDVLYSYITKITLSLYIISPACHFTPTFSPGFYVYVLGFVVFAAKRTFIELRT